MRFLLFSSLVEWNKLQAGAFYSAEAFPLENKAKAVPQIQPQVSSLGKGLFPKVLTGSDGSCGSSRLPQPSL